MKKDQPLRCCICTAVIEPEPVSGWRHGNNAAPVTIGGRCCNECNAMIVIPARLRRLRVRDRDPAA